MALKKAYWLFVAFVRLLFLELFQFSSVNQLFKSKVLSPNELSINGMLEFQQFHWIFMTQSIF